MKIIKTSNYVKINQTNQFGNPEPTRANDWPKDQTTKERTNYNITTYKQLEDIGNNINNKENKDFNEDNYKDKMIASDKKSILLSGKIKNKSKQLNSLSKQYYPQIPLQELFNILKEENILPLQEDNTQWAGFLMGAKECGSEESYKQKVNIPLAQLIDNKLIPIKNSELILSWCVMPSGNYEINTYLS